MPHQRQFSRKKIEKYLPFFILLLAFGFQTNYLVELRDTFPDSFIGEPFCGVDAKAHLERASGLLDGSVPGNYTYYFIPFYPFYLAILKQFLGDSLLLPVFGQALLQLVGIAALYGIGRLTFSRLTGVLAALGLATYNYYLFYLPCFDQVLLTVPALTLAVFFLLKYDYEQKSRWLLVAGIALAAAILSRPTILTVFPPLIVWLYFNFRRSRDGAAREKIPQTFWPLARDIIFLVLPFLIAAAPISWHNFRVSGRFILLSDNFDVNIFTGNNPEAAGLDSLIQPQSQPAVLYFEELFPRVSKGETTLTAEVLRYIGEQPGDWLALMAAKTWLWFGEVDERLLSPFFPLTISPYPGEYRSRILGPLPLEWQALAIVALLGLVLASAEGRSSWRVALLWLVYGAFSAATILFFVQLRFRLPFIPFVIVSAASLLAMAGQWRRQRSWRFWATLAGLLLLYPIAPTLWIFILVFIGLGLGGDVQNFRKFGQTRGDAASFKGEYPPRPPVCPKIFDRPGLGREKSANGEPVNNESGSNRPPFSIGWLIAPICIYLLAVGLWVKAEALASDVSQTIDHYLGPPLAAAGILARPFRWIVTASTALR